MSSDPIEVLRDLRVGVEMDAAHDPQGPAKLAAIDAALASLSTSQEANNRAKQLEQARDLLEKVKLYMERRWCDLEGRHLMSEIYALLWRTGDE